MSSSKDRRRHGGRASALAAALSRGKAVSAARPTLPGASTSDRLQEQEDLHRLACEAGRTGSWYLRLDTRECVLSPMAAALLGLPAQELVLPPELWRRHVDPAHLEGMHDAARASIEGGQPFDFEFRVIRSDGTEHWLYARGGVVRDETGKAVRVHGALVDLSEHKRAKDELARLNATLEERVAARTAELLEAQDALRQSQKLEAMGQLTGGMAHDFNNLLTPIIASLDRLSENAAERDRRLIDAALKSAESARLLIRRLLAFARRQPLQPVRVDVAELIVGVEDLIARTLGPQIRVELKLEEKLAPALADPNQVEMAILNLSVNAKDAMPSGGILTITATNERLATQRSGLAPGEYVRIGVIDTGTGMDEETLARAVEPFFSTKQVGEGTGLGLSMVHGLASQLGGALELASTPGRGTAVTLWLPAWTGQGPDSSRPKADEAPARERGATALLVDDHDLVRMTTAELLQDLGYDVVEAKSAEEAVRLVSGGLRAQLVLTDHLMPGMTGADLARLLRSHSPKTAILLMSGDAGAAGAAPDLPCLTKPFRKADLEAALASVTGRTHPPAAGEPPEFTGRAPSLIRE